jgi:hypothetical protein
LIAWRYLASKYNEIEATLYLAEYELARGNVPQASAGLAEAEQLLARYDGANRFRSRRAQLNKLRRSLRKIRQAAANQSEKQPLLDLASTAATSTAAASVNQRPGC